MKTKLIKAVKIVVILSLVLAISVVSIIHWKSDEIIMMVLDTAKEQLTDSLSYEEVQVNSFRYFPGIAIQLNQLRVGSGPAPLLQGGNIDVVVRLWPLLKNQLDIRSIRIRDADIHLLYQDGKWSYDILKKSEDNSKKGWNTLVQQLDLHNTRLTYNDGHKLSFRLDLTVATMKGELRAEKMDALLIATGQITELKSGSYTPTPPFSFDFRGWYVSDFKTGFQEYKDWQVETEGMEVTATGTIQRNDDHEYVDLLGEWKNVKPESIKKWVPQDIMSGRNSFTLNGNSEGTFGIKGASSKKQTPVITLQGNLKNGGLLLSASDTEIKHLSAEFHYVSENPAHHNNSTVQLKFEKGSMLSESLKGDVLIVDLERPAYAISLDGTCPATLISLVSAPGLTFSGGEFVLKGLEIREFRSGANLGFALWQKVKGHVSPKNVKGQYLNNPVEFPTGTIASDGAGSIQFEMNDMVWGKAAVEKLKGSITAGQEGLHFEFNSQFCGGDVVSKGKMVTGTSGSTFHADWQVKGIDVQALMESFSNFDQTFITSENLSGKSDIWAETIIPMDTSLKIIPKDILVKSALRIRDGRLVNLKTLDDFGKYIHIEDLRDIRFNELRNYLKIEDGKIHLPVMFIQSSAVNLSIAGIHGFDHRILYNVKLNGGQTIAGKIKKTDFKKDMKPARKSGWINLYFVLEGTASEVRYQQYRTGVISGFEQSALLKESLRNYLVDRFGYDVYWLEPNEWEEIPEYE